MKIRVWCDSGANIHSKREEILDVEDVGFTAEEWASLTDEAKEDAAREVAFNNLDWGFEEIQ